MPSNSPPRFTTAVNEYYLLDVDGGDPVSYTHLDVYKRQNQVGPASQLESSKA